MQPLLGMQVGSLHPSGAGPQTKFPTPTQVKTLWQEQLLTALSAVPRSWACWRGARTKAPAIFAFPAMDHPQPCHLPLSPNPGLAGWAAGWELLIVLQKSKQLEQGNLKGSVAPCSKGKQMAIMTSYRRML